MANVTSSYSSKISHIEYLVYRESGQIVVTYLSLLFIVGILGNSHVIIVYRNLKQLTNYQIFIFVIAINDLLACVLSLPFEIVHVRFKYTFEGSGSCKIFRFFYYSFILSSGLLLALVAVERVRKIYAPFKVQMSKKIVTISSGIVIGFSFLISTPTLIFFDIVPKQIDNYPGLYGTNCGASNRKFRSMHFIILLVISTMAFLVVLITYSIIAHVILRQRRHMRRTSEIQMSTSVTEVNSLTEISAKKVQESSSGDRSTLSRGKTSTIRRCNPCNSQGEKQMQVAIRNTLTLMVASAVSYIGLLPIILRAIIRIVDEDAYDDIDRSLGPVGKNILIRGYFLNNVVNPFVYCFMDRCFRKGLARLYRPILSLITKKP